MPEPPLTDAELQELQPFRKVGVSAISDTRLRTAVSKITEVSFDVVKTRLDQFDDLNRSASSRTSKRLIGTCRRQTLLSVKQYQSELLATSVRYAYICFRRFKFCGQEFDALQEYWNASKTPSRARKLSIALAELNTRQRYDDLDLYEVLDAIDLVSRALFKNILPIRVSKDHLATAKELVWTTLSNTTPLGFLDYLEVVRKADPIKRLKLKIAAADEWIRPLEGYLEDLAGWLEGSRALQLRIEDEIAKSESAA